MEYCFKNDSLMSMTFFTDKQTPKVGRCISEISVDGKYNKFGPLFLVSLNQSSLNVKLIKFALCRNNSFVSESQIICQIQNSAKLLIANFTEMQMIYVLHDNPDIISFVYGDENNAIDVEFHRPTKPIEQIFGLDDSDFVDEIANPAVVDNTSLSMYEESKEVSPTIKLLKSVGIFLLFLLLSLVTITLLKFGFGKELSRMNSARKSVNIRLRYSIIRFVLRIIVIGVGIVLLFNVLRNAMYLNRIFCASVVCGAASLLIRLVSLFSLPMNFMTMQRFVSKKRNFILYLRGFATDNYTPSLEEMADIVLSASPGKTKIDIEGKSPNECSLNEKSLAKAWKRYYKTYGVGLPEELESPEGMSRIYLDNESWMNDVKALMKLAKYILVSVNPNDNCIWEIKQCNIDFAEKTIYYVDDIANLNMVREKMGEDLPACLKSEEIIHNHMMVYKKDGQVIVRAYSNTESGLKNVVRDFFNHQ